MTNLISPKESVKSKKRGNVDSKYAEACACMSSLPISGTSTVWTDAWHGHSRIFWNANRVILYSLSCLVSPHGNTLQCFDPWPSFSYWLLFFAGFWYQMLQWVYEREYDLAWPVPVMTNLYSAYSSCLLPFITPKDLAYGHSPWIYIYYIYFMKA